jgi:hypothetical protein
LSQTVKQARATTTLASSANPSTFGQSVTFTATVAPASPGAGTPTGTVTFYDGSNAIGTGALTGGVASFTISTLSVGTHSIKAVYGGDANFKTSTSDSLKQKVQAAPAIAVAGTTAFSKRVHGGVSSTPAKAPTGLLIDGVLDTLQAETASATAIGDLAFDRVTRRDGGRAD